MDEEKAGELRRMLMALDAKCAMHGMSTCKALMLRGGLSESTARRLLNGAHGSEETFQKVKRCFDLLVPRSMP